MKERTFRVLLESVFEYCCALTKRPRSRYCLPSSVYLPSRYCLPSSRVAARVEQMAISQTVENEIIVIFACGETPMSRLNLLSKIRSALTVPLSHLHSNRVFLPFQPTTYANTIVASIKELMTGQSLIVHIEWLVEINFPLKNPVAFAEDADAMKVTRNSHCWSQASRGCSTG